jgi:hypothetical protein
LKLSKVDPFVLYRLRDTLLTRLGASGCGVDPDAYRWHSSIAISSRYVHPSGDIVVDAVERMENGRRKRKPARLPVVMGTKVGTMPKSVIRGTRNESLEAQHCRMVIW